MKTTLTAMASMVMITSLALGDSPIIADPRGDRFETAGVQGEVVFFRAEDHEILDPHYPYEISPAEHDPAITRIRLINTNDYSVVGTVQCLVFNFGDIAIEMEAPRAFNLQAREESEIQFQSEWLNGASAMECSIEGAPQ